MQVNCALEVRAVVKAVTHNMSQKPFVCAVCGNLISCGEGHYRAGVQGIHVACYEKLQTGPPVLGAPFATVIQPRRRSNSSGTVPTWRERLPGVAVTASDCCPEY